jgi:mono/diheme cytochrome c family protein
VRAENPLNLHRNVMYPRGRGAKPPLRADAAIVGRRMACRLLRRSAAAVLLGAAVAGCGSSSGPSSPGKKVFASAGCGACHTLADAGATGNVGPDLDRVKPPYALVVRFVTHGRQGMPSFAGRLTAQQIRDVASYVSRAAARARPRAG